MSSDLLAEFDCFYQAPSEAPNPDILKPGARDPKTHSFFDELSSLNPAKPDGQSVSENAPADQDADDWGAFESFEELSIDPTSPKPQKQIRSEQRTFWDDLSGLESPGKPLQAHRGQLPSTFHLISPQCPPSQPSFHASGYDADIDVLFDAEALGLGEDEFGDFESVNAEPPDHPSQTPELGLRPTPARFSATNNGLEELKPSTKPRPNVETPEPPLFLERNPFAELSISSNPPEGPRKHHETGTPITAWPSFVPSKPEPVQQDASSEAAYDDSRGQFTESPVLSITATETSKKTMGKEWAFSAPRTTNMPLKLPHNSTVAPRKPAPAPTQPIGTTSGSPTSITKAPPTNIPPPSILLSLFSPLFNLPQTALFTPLSTHPTPLKERILSDPSILIFLRGYLLLATVCARLIAGRKLRWKRDTHLSQNMKIGAAQSSKLSGMKLAGIDKAENLKEEREVADVVRIWKEQLGKLRSAVAAANASGASPPLGVIPEIVEVLPVRVAKPAKGAVVAEKACVLCGLKREERVERVDQEVEDTFGEWWVEYWGHLVCRNFWDEHKDELRRNSHM
ncbi:MAG: hypothetical protein M1835_003137 [Candelina submexicana]|nr:MAG: hypothetical protein M1835_003137 [Candelina submexicana]